MSEKRYIKEGILFLVLFRKCVIVLSKIILCNERLSALENKQLREIMFKVKQSTFRAFPKKSKSNRSDQHKENMRGDFFFFCLTYVKVYLSFILSPTGTFHVKISMGTRVKDLHEEDKQLKIK